MARRFPQPIRVGDLIGLPVLDWRDRTIGYVQQVVRTPTGKIQLIVPYRSWLGWFSYGRVFAWGTRPVAVPLETVAMLGRQVAALDMSREEFDAAPVFTATQASADRTRMRRSGSRSRSGNNFAKGKQLRPAQRKHGTEFRLLG